MEANLVSLWVVGSLISLIRCETKCFRNEEIGDVEDNVYYCSDDAKPECCEQNSEFTCCESNDSKSWREQAQLWGTVAALVLLIGLIFYCCKNDTSCCNGDDRTLIERLRFRKKQEPKLTDLSQEGKEETPPRNSNSRYGNFPPLPPEARRESHSHGGHHGGRNWDQRGHHNLGYSKIEDDDYRY